MKTSFSAGILRVLFIGLVATTGVLTTACKKEDEVINQDFSAIDEDIIKKYLTDNNVTTAQKQPSGFYFLPVTTKANGVKVAAGSTVSVLYTGRLLDAAGTVFDATSRNNNVPLTFTVGAGRLIPGFEAGIALMHIGDKAELLLPSALAYGPRGNGSIPANAVVRFEVEVVDFTVVDDNLITKYLADKNITTAQKQPSGLYFLPVSTNLGGVSPAAGASVTVHYTGRFLDPAGTVFNTSQGKSPLNFVLGSNQVIKGFDAGIALMRKGDKAELLIPSALAYGPAGAGGGIVKPNTVLRFEVELVDVK